MPDGCAINFSYLDLAVGSHHSEWSVCRRTRDALSRFVPVAEAAKLGNVHAFAEKLDFSRYRTLCDVTGATVAPFPSFRCSSRNPNTSVSQIDTPLSWKLCPSSG